MNTTEYPIVIFTEDSEYVDSAANVGSAESVLYGDMSYYTIPRIIQIPISMEDVITEMQYLIDINSDCYGIEPDRIELVLC